MSRRWKILILAISCAAILSGSWKCVQRVCASTDRSVLATEFVQCLVDGRFPDAESYFDSTVSQLMPVDRLKATWESVIQQAGAVKSVGEIRQSQQGESDIVLVACHMEKTPFDLKLVFDKNGRIGGLWFLPYAGASAPQYTPPAYALKNNFDESEVTVGTGDWKLPGTLSMPKGDGPFPAVVLVQGSGPNDRDETIGPNKPFRDLAWGLASQGIAVLRYDKRTKVYGAKMMQSPNKVTVREEVVDDAIVALKLLRDTKKVNPNKVFVLGHSLGGMMVPRIGKADPKTAGLIMMAGGSTRPMEDTILDQYTYIASLDGAPSAESKKVLDNLKQQVANVKSPKLSLTTPASSLPLGSMGMGAAYWLDLKGYNSAETAKSLKMPMLCLQGGRDYQCTKAYYDDWVKAMTGRPDTTCKLYPTLNHLFMDGTGRSTPQEYDKRGPIPQTVVDDIRTWIKAH